MKDPLIVIGVTGLARSGKDSVAKILAAHHGFTRVALADGIRSAFTGVSGPGWDMHKDFGGFNSFLPRQMMQTLGTECREDIGRESLWVDVALATIRYAEHYHPRRVNLFVVPDVRYPHERSRIGDAVKQWGGRFEMWKVERDGPKVKGSHHSSETMVDQVRPDLVIDNRQTFRYLASQVLAAADEIMASVDAFV